MLTLLALGALAAIGLGWTLGRALAALLPSAARARTLADGDARKPEVATVTRAAPAPAAEPAGQQSR